MTTDDRNMKIEVAKSYSEIEKDDTEFWKSKSPEERLDMVEILRYLKIDRYGYQVKKKNNR